ncbi:MAG: hypothetical protein WCS73_12170 [Lentisphaeria bacterium]
MKKQPESIKELVLMTGMSQTKISDIIGCRQSAVSQTLRGRITSQKICTVIDKFAKVAPGTTEKLAQEFANVRRKAILENMDK